MADLSEFLEVSEVEAELKSPEMLEQLAAWAEAKVVPVWKSFSPVGDPATDPHSGQYRDSIKVFRDGDQVYVGSDDPIANLIEYGSEHNQEYAPRAKTEEYFNNLADTGEIDHL